MTTEKTIVVHHTPPGKDSPIVAMAQKKGATTWHPCGSLFVRCNWHLFAAWYDPQIGEVERPARYVMKLTGDGWNIIDTQYNGAIATSIPTREAAQAIADIYERANGGEA